MKLQRNFDIKSRHHSKKGLENEEKGTEWLKNRDKDYCPPPKKKSVLPADY